MIPPPVGALVSAGEPSGDAHAAPVLRTLRQLRPEWSFEGCGGNEMAGAGLEVVVPVERLAVLGFLEALRAIPRHLRVLHRLEQRGRAGRYRLGVLVDYPGFHLRLGERLRRLGIPVLQFVAPQLWAWRAERLGLLRRAADRVAAILPFEEAWFRARDIDCHFVGHPVVDRIPVPRGEARRILGLPDDAVVLAIFPGSRTGETVRNWPFFSQVAAQLLAERRCTHVVVAETPAGGCRVPGEFQVSRDGPDVVFGAATAALVKSGTVTLEAAWADVPHVVAYRASRTTYAIARRLMTVQQISLANLVAAADVIPEFWHLPLSVARVAAALRPLLDPGSSATAAQRSGLALVRERLGPPGVAGRVARLALDLVPG